MSLLHSPQHSRTASSEQHTEPTIIQTTHYDQASLPQNTPVLNSPTNSIQSSVHNATTQYCFLCNHVMNDKAECLLIVGCSHVFHRLCIEQYLSNANVCPICQQSCELGDLQKITVYPKPCKTKGKPRGAMAKQYHTRSFSKNLSQEQNDSSIVEPLPTTPNHRNSGRNGPLANIFENRHVQQNVQQATVNYDEIARMIENSVSKALANLNISANIPVPATSPCAFPTLIPRQLSNMSGDQNNNRNVQNPTNQNVSAPQPTPNYSNHSSSSISFHTDKITSVIQNWGLKFDGAPSSISVEEFLYRVRSLTRDHFGGDFSNICKNLNILLSGKARDWFWRYRKQVDVINWEDFCDAIRLQYKDYKSTSDIREEIRNRKQKPGESFELFFEAISTIMDRLPSPMCETELIEIITRNLRPEVRQDLLYVPINSIPHLRRLVQMRESFLNEEYVRRNFSARSTNFSSGRRQISEILSDHEPNYQDSHEERELKVDAVRPSEHVPCCWNCDQPGHRWEDCLQIRTIFCYGCGEKNTYKPQCQTCINRKPKNCRGSQPKIDPI